MADDDLRTFDELRATVAKLDETRKYAEHELAAIRSYARVCARTGACPLHPDRLASGPGA